MRKLQELRLRVDTLAWLAAQLIDDETITELEPRDIGSLPLGEQLKLRREYPNLCDQHDSGTDGAEQRQSALSVLRKLSVLRDLRRGITSLRESTPELILRRFVDELEKEIRRQMAHGDAILLSREIDASPPTIEPTAHPHIRRVVEALAGLLATSGAW